MPTLQNPRHEIFAQELAKGKSATEAHELAGLDRRSCSSLAGFYVYALVDPRDDRVFYVGKGKGRRYAAHYREWVKGQVVNGAKFERIASIASEGLKPEAVCLEDGLTEPAAYRLERVMIQRIGRATLSNAVPGVRSQLERVLAETRDSISRIIPYRVWLKAKARTEYEKSIYRKVVEGLNRVRISCEQQLAGPI